MTNPYAGNSFDDNDANSNAHDVNSDAYDVNSSDADSQNTFGQFPNGDNAQEFADLGGAARPNTYLVWTILATVACCLPVGAVGIYFSTQVDSRWHRGDLQGAEDASVKAKKFAIASAVITLIVFALYMALLVTGVISPDDLS
ncbi:CD225/dispanin family protein [Corynebacterium sp. 319]|uniref:CD225/dispanin family protein n=1 Tax=unclassified Corynebacterium TaxID=2624378 RepID=UPI00125CA70A|nr:MULTISPECIES: CD225/dispanin family protein [unclassified Corynebacterium]KAB1553472.1 CD225/dispanin family protein [Corynebacterium sp. 319]KAB3540784.1 CD225/dispanin family protein [Corynebacterium sp. 366]